ncbi:uncharacterized protein LOC110810398 [Carica papaya]|uniref:uncharacterized protein LOC110810398 n=1 Tax=Carica papaya TaxID=3649 RepID=UPI000B8CFA2A|nr:uncharacterized protein LOC110810398 [Carica papaya]
MDLGCLDMGCISVSDKHSNDVVLDSQGKEAHSPETTSSASKPGKSKTLKDNGPSTLNALNKFTSQIKKPPHRKNSPLNWFPRRKVESYLKRKIKMLQEVDGMNLTLDETLGDSNPHYSRVLREKMAAREAANKAMEARKAALVEASWCRILRAARIQSKEAETQLLKAEKAAAEAFEAAASIGVIMYDMPNCPQKPSEVETSVNGGESTTHTVTASFETAFEVDKEVAAAVKTAFTRLENCSSFNKDELKDILRKIRETPDADDGHQDLSEVSECETELGTEHETFSEKDCVRPQQDLDNKMPVIDMRNRKSRRRESFGKLKMVKLVDMMLERLQCFHEDELSSLATIVATCGLNATLAEVGNGKLQNLSSSASTVNGPRRMSSMGAGGMRNSSFECFMGGNVRKKQAELEEFPTLDKYLVRHMTKLEKEVLEARNAQKNAPKEGEVDGSNELNDGMGTLSRLECFMDGNVRKKQAELEEFPSLDKYLVKHMTKLEKEVLEAKNAQKNVPKEGERDGSNEVNDGMGTLSSNINPVESIPELGRILVKHSMKFEREIEEAKKNAGESFMDGNVRKKQAELEEFPSLDKYLVKHMTKLEKEVLEAKNAQKNVPKEGERDGSNEVNDGMGTLSSNINPVESIPELRRILVKHSMKFEREIEEAKKNAGESFGTAHENSNRELVSSEAIPDLGSMLVKHSSKLEKEIEETKRNFANAYETNDKRKGRTEKGGMVNRPELPSLDKFLVKHVSRLEKEVMQARNRSKIDDEGSNAAALKKTADSSALGSEEQKDDSFCSGRLEKENIDSNKAVYERMTVSEKELKVNPKEPTINSLEKILVKPLHRLEKEKMKASLLGIKYEKNRLRRRGNDVTDYESLDKVLIKHVPRLEKEKMRFNAAEEEVTKVKKNSTNVQLHINEEGSLDQILVKHKSRLEREKTAAKGAEQPGDQTRISISRKEARERELQEAWGGLSLGNSMKPHVSKLQRDKAAWIEAEEEERRQATKM